VAYTNPTFAQLKTKVSRDLRDPNNLAFTTGDVGDFINDGVAELNELRPVESSLLVTDPLDFNGILYDYVWRVLVHDAATHREFVVPPNNDEASEFNGWTLFAGNLKLPGPLLARLTDMFEAGTADVRVYGYYLRNVLTADDQVTQFENSIEEQAVRQYARWRGWDALRNDRGLYQQWQTQANNSDVSATQLTNMAATSDSEWSRTRRRIYLIRRPAVGW
jgi:hypothetical protein